MKYVFFDIECSNSFVESSKICSFGYVLTDEKFNIIKKEDIFINPSGKFKLSDIDPGKYTIYTVHPQTGAVNMSEKSVRIDTTIEKENIKANQIYWIRKL